MNRNPRHQNIISIRLPQSLNKGIWEFIQQNSRFIEFMQNCMDDTSKQIAITKQTINEVTLKVEVWDTNCDIDEMNCKNICVTFYTSEGTYKKYSFDSKILLSDFNTPAETAIMGSLLIQLIRKEEVKHYNSISKFSFVFLGIFVFSWAVSYYFLEGVNVLLSTLTLGMLLALLWMIIESHHPIKKDKDFMLDISFDSMRKGFHAKPCRSSISAPQIGDSYR